MIIQGTSITVAYKKIDEIKKAYYANDSLLKDFFNEATVLPIPEDAPVEIPRIIIKTLNEHAQLNISPIAATFEVRYNEGFEKRWDYCSDYLKIRMEKVFEFLNILTGNTYEYIGLVSNILFDEVEEDGCKVISNSLLKSDRIRDIYDINIRYTFVENNNLFTNIMLQNARIFSHGIDASVAGSFGLKNQNSESIGVIVDINDRYGFNTVENYKSNSSILNDLINSMSNIIDNKLIDLVMRGEY